MKEEEEEEEERGTIVECLTSMRETLGSVLNSTKKREERRKGENKLIFSFFLSWWQKPGIGSI